MGEFAIVYQYLEVRGFRIPASITLPVAVELFLQ